MITLFCVCRIMPPHMYTGQRIVGVPGMELRSLSGLGTSTFTSWAISLSMQGLFGYHLGLGSMQNNGFGMAFWCMYADTHIHTYIHIQTYIHTYIHTHTYTYTHIHAHTYIHTHTHIYTHIYAQSYTYTPYNHATCVRKHIFVFLHLALFIRQSLVPPRPLQGHDFTLWGWKALLGIIATLTAWLVLSSSTLGGIAVNASSSCERRLNSSVDMLCPLGNIPGA